MSTTLKHADSPTVEAEEDLNDVMEAEVYEDTEIPVHDEHAVLNSFHESASFCGSSVSSVISDDEELLLDIMSADARGEKLLEQSVGDGEDDDEVSDTDSRLLVHEWNQESDSQSDSDSTSTERQPLPKRISSLLAKDGENDENNYDDELQFYDGAPAKEGCQIPEQEVKEEVEVDVPDHIWETPKIPKKNIASKDTKAKTKHKKKTTSKDINEDVHPDEKPDLDDSSSESSFSSFPEGQLEATVSSVAATPSEGVSTPLANTGIDQIPYISPGKIGKKKLGKTQYDQEEYAPPSVIPDGISRYNPLFYRESKQAPLVDHSYRSKKEKIQAKKERKKQLAEDRKRTQEFNKKLDEFFALGGIAGDEEEPKDDAAEGMDEEAGNEEAGNETGMVEDSSGDESSEFDFFDDDSLDSIEGFTTVKKTNRRKKAKKASSSSNHKKKAAQKKKKVEKKRGRRLDYEIDDPTLETEKPPSISIAERVEAIFNNKELIFQQYDYPAEEVEGKSSSSHSKGKSKGRKGERTDVTSRRNSMKERSNSGSNLLVDRRSVLSGRRSNSFGSLKPNVARRQEGRHGEARTGSSSHSSGEKRRSNSIGTLAPIVKTRDRSRGLKIGDNTSAEHGHKRSMRRNSLDDLRISSHEKSARSKQRRPDKVAGADSGSRHSRSPQRHNQADSAGIGRSGHTKKPASLRGDIRAASKSIFALWGKKAVSAEENIVQTEKAPESPRDRTDSKSPSALRGKRLESESNHSKKSSREGRSGVSAEEGNVQAEKGGDSKSRTSSKSPSVLRGKRLDSESNHSKKSSREGRSGVPAEEDNVRTDKRGEFKTSASFRDRTGSKSPSVLRGRRVESEESGHSKRSTREGRGGVSAEEDSVQTERAGDIKKPQSLRDRTGSKSPGALRGTRVEAEGSGHSKRSAREGRAGSKSPSALQGRRTDENDGSKSPSVLKGRRTDESDGSKSPSVLKGRRTDESDGSKSPSVLKGRRTDESDGSKSPSVLKGRRTDESDGSKSPSVLKGRRTDESEGGSERNERTRKNSREGRTTSKSPSVLRGRHHDEGEGGGGLDRSGHSKKTSREGRTTSKSPSIFRGRRNEQVPSKYVDDKDDGVGIPEDGVRRKKTGYKDKKSRSKSIEI
eukprot:scaffold5088_cov98-Cylindrotheca_fusiformis.AAC.6